ncbi:hypothetical protein D3C85_850370 [compost metagenome]
MKNIGIVFILMFCFLSCSNSGADSVVITSYYGKWKLTKRTGVFILALYMEGNPQWQEFYDFKTDGTFTKTRVQETTKTFASGKFEIKKNQNETQLNLTYTEDNDIIGNCFGNLSEDLYINSEGLLTSSWQMCDGPGLFYEKMR